MTTAAPSEAPSSGVPTNGAPTNGDPSNGTPSAKPAIRHPGNPSTTVRTPVRALARTPVRTLARALFRTVITLLRQAWQVDRLLTAVGLTMVVVIAAAAVGLVTDHEVITGAPAWLKPAKFAISIAIYSFTFLWLLTYISGHRRLVRVAAVVTAMAFAVEMVLIAGAAALGTTSHFNVSTPTQAAVWSVMGTAIVCAWVANLLVGFLLLRQRIDDLALAWSLRLGVLVSAVGMGVAFFMTAPTPAQLSAAHAGDGIPIIGAHSVGVPDGGPGLPVVGWSTVGGDLRVGHFIGLHALQALPLFGLLLAKVGPAWLTRSDRVRLVWAVGLAYLGVVVLTTWQALRGQPLASPDSLTLGALAAILLAATVTVTAVLVRARARRTTVGGVTGIDGNAGISGGTVAGDEAEERGHDVRTV